MSPGASSSAIHQGHTHTARSRNPPAGTSPRRAVHVAECDDLVFPECGSSSTSHSPVRAAPSLPESGSSRVRARVGCIAEHARGERKRLAILFLKLRLCVSGREIERSLSLESMHQLGRARASTARLQERGTPKVSASDASDSLRRLVCLCLCRQKTISDFGCAFSMLRGAAAKSSHARELYEYAHCGQRSHVWDDRRCVLWRAIHTSICARPSKYKAGAQKLEKYHNSRCRTPSDTGGACRARANANTDKKKARIMHPHTKDERK